MPSRENLLPQGQVRRTMPLARFTARRVGRIVAGREGVRRPDSDHDLSRWNGVGRRSGSQIILGRSDLAIRFTNYAPATRCVHQTGSSPGGHNWT